MKQPTSTSSESSLRNAQDATIQSIAKFETALEHLADKVENTNHRVEHVGQVVSRLKDDFVHLKTSAKNAVQPILPYVAQGKHISERAWTGARQHPRSLLWIAAGIVGFIWASRSMSKPSKPAFVSDTEY